MIINNFDCIVIVVLIVLNIILWKKKIPRRLGCILSGWLISFALPVISMFIEVGEETKDEVIVDSFNLLYFYYKFPVYWVIGMIQSWVLNYISNHPIQKRSDKSLKK